MLRLLERIRHEGRRGQRRYPACYANVAQAPEPFKISRIRCQDSLEMSPFDARSRLPEGCRLRRMFASRAFPNWLFTAHTGYSALLRGPPGPGFRPHPVLLAT